MNRLLSILFLAFFLGELYTHAQQPTATLTTQTFGAGGVPYKTAPWGLANTGGWVNIGNALWRLTYLNLPPNATVAATITVRYTPRPGNTHVQSFTVAGGNTAQPTGVATATMNGSNGALFAIAFNRSQNGTPPIQPGMICGTYNLSVSFTVNGQPGTAPQAETGNVEYAAIIQQMLPQQTNTSQQNQTNILQQWGLNNWKVGSIINMSGTNTVRGKVVVLKRVYNRSRGTVEVSKNGILHTRGFLNFQGGNNRQKLRNYRYRSVPKK